MDKREAILTRLFDVLKSIPDMKQWVRNRTELPDEKRPAITLMDGDEAALESTYEKGRIARGPNLITMKPEIYVTLETRKPDNKLVGQDLNKYRAIIIKAVTTDPELITLTGGDVGNIRYLSGMTDLARGRNVDGELGLLFAFVYLLKPTEL